MKVLYTVGLFQSRFSFIGTGDYQDSRRRDWEKCLTPVPLPPPTHKHSAFFVVLQLRRLPCAINDNTYCNQVVAARL